MVCTNRIYNFRDSTFSSRSEISFSTKFNTSEAPEPTKSWWWIFRSLFLFVPLALALNWTDKWICIKETPGPMLDAMSSLLARFKTHLFPKKKVNTKGGSLSSFLHALVGYLFALARIHLFSICMSAPALKVSSPTKSGQLERSRRYLPWHKENNLGDQVWGLRL